MSGDYFTPMYGGILLPGTRRQGSAQSQLNSSFSARVGFPGTATPLDEAYPSPFTDMSPHHEGDTPYFGFSLGMPGPSIHDGSPVDGDRNLHFKRPRSIDSASSSTDVSPVSESSGRLVKVARPVVAFVDAPVVRVGKGTSRKNAHLERLEELADDPNPPILKLGDDGRSRLKSALSDLVRMDPEIQRRVEAIGKIRLASMQQLMRMAKVSGLWGFALDIAAEVEATRIRRSS